MISPVFNGTASGGKIVKIWNIERWRAWLEKLEGPIQIVVRRPSKPRSNSENAYYWGVVVSILSKELGYSPQEMHEALKWRFLRSEHEKLPTVRSTTGLSTVEFEEYLEAIRAFAASELSIYIPEPNEVYEQPQES